MLFNEFVKVTDSFEGAACPSNNIVAERNKAAEISRRTFKYIKNVPHVAGCFSRVTKTQRETQKRWVAVGIIWRHGPSARGDDMHVC